MRFSTIAAVSTILFAGFAAACKSDADCPRGQTCQFLGIKDSQGQCYKRNEGPAAAGVGPSASKPSKSTTKKSTKKRDYVPRRNAARAPMDLETIEIIAREVVHAELDARGLFEDADLADLY